MNLANLPRFVSLSAVLLACAARADAALGDPGKGEAVFQQNCVICHGPQGKGDGAAAAGLNPKPANFSERQASTAQKQLNVVTNGGASEKLSPLMPAFGESLSDQQLKDVIAYVRAKLSGTKTASK
jgi:mono/diheme cytochrome c family protein